MKFSKIKSVQLMLTLFVAFLITGLLIILFFSDLDICNSFFTQSVTTKNTVISLDDKVTIYKVKFSKEFISLQKQPYAYKWFTTIPAQHHLDINYRFPQYYAFLDKFNTIQEIEDEAVEAAQFYNKYRGYTFCISAVTAIFITAFIVLVVVDR